MNLRAALRDQAESCRQLGSPFTASLLALAADRLAPGTPVADRLLAWTGDPTSRGQSVPLRLAGSLHGLVLTGAAPDLAACYPPNLTPPADRLWDAVHDAMVRHAATLNAWLDRPPQTNETGRSAVLIAAAHMLAARFGLPLVLSELGASAGLNLNFDRYALALPDGTRLGPREAVLTLAPDWRGDRPVPAAPRVAERRGADLTPLDPTDPDDAVRLCAYVWPDQPDRLARTRAALAAAAPWVDTADAADWIAPRLATRLHGRLHLVFHTVAWQYFPRQVQDRAQAAIEAAGAAATADAPLARLGMEADGDPRGAGLTLQLWPSGESIELGRADFHGRWVDWRNHEWP